MADLVMRQSSMRSTGVPLGGGTAKPTFLSGTEKWHKISRMRRSCEHGGTGGSLLDYEIPEARTRRALHNRCIDSWRKSRPRAHRVNRSQAGIDQDPDQSPSTRRSGAITVWRTGQSTAVTTDWE